MSDGRVLVVGASGHLGGAIARQLLAAGVPVRAMGRRREALEPLAAAGAEVVAADMRDLKKTTEACRGVAQIAATANNNMGKGATSPMRVDLTGYQNLCAAARNTGVRRLLFVSYRGVTSGETVDIFRLKWYIEDAIRRSGVPHVILRPSALMDVWVNDIIGAGVRKNGVAMVFGDGTAVTNYVAVEDVAEFAVRILARPEIVDENIDVGGPSNLSMNDLATLVEKTFGGSGRRRHIPVAALALLPAIVKPFNETAARMMTIGHHVATHSSAFAQWKAVADRFGVSPRTVEAYLSALSR